MASSSSPRTWRYRVFTSFHGPDVRKTFLSHLRKQFNYNGITMFNDEGIERSQIIAPALKNAIKESRIAIVLLSKNYASSSWCLDELLEILKCKEDVMTVFYGVDPSDVRKQTGEFGISFDGTCVGKTEEKRKKWSQALTYVGNIAGEHFQNWDNEANMIEKIASDVSHKLNATPSRDFDGMVGLEGHLREIDYLLDLDNDKVKIVGISGPAGIGKSTIAIALQSTLCHNFQYTCFMDNLRENCKLGLGEYGLKVRLQEQLLSKVLNLNEIRICHLGVTKERLYDQRVLIILDDVESLDQLDALADIRWFGPGSRIIVTTKNKEILQQHGINDIYLVDFPSKSEALMIFCLSAFRQTSQVDGFEKLTDEVVRICGDLPLGLHVLGSSLRGKSQADWIDELPRLRNCLDGRIESVLKMGYERLHEKDQALFLHIAIFFNYEHVDHVTSMLAKPNLNVRLGLKILANRYLIHIDSGSSVLMHHLLQVMARQVISKQEPWKRQILVDSQEICYVLENATGNGSIVGLSFDVVEINELIISVRAFERMTNLIILKVYDGKPGKRQLHIPEELEFPRCLRLLHWDAYPRKSLPLRFCPQHLIELNMAYSQLEKLWEGNQPLANLKKIDLFWAYRLKELPDLSTATNLESLDLTSCHALVELPSSISNLHKIAYLWMSSCKSLQVIPTLINLASLQRIDMYACSRLRSFPDIPTNVTKIEVTGTVVEELPGSLRHYPRLEYVYLSGSVNLKTFLTHLPTSVTHIDLSNSGIERISDSIKGLHGLVFLNISSCKRLTSLPELPRSLERLTAFDCESLERVTDPLNSPNAELNFINCIELGRQARRIGLILQLLFVRGRVLLPGREVPAEFDHRATGNILTIPHYGFFRFKVCVVISPNRVAKYIHSAELLCRCIVISNLVNSADMTISISDISSLRTEHLFIFHCGLPFIDRSEVITKIVLQFSSGHKNFDIIECGIKILRDETDGRNDGESGDKDGGFDPWYRYRSGETLEEEEGDDGFDLFLNEDIYKYEIGEASKDKDECIADDEDYKSVSRKRPRQTTMTSTTTNLECGVQRRRF